MSVLTRYALSLVVLVAALALCLSPGSTLAATEDVSANPGETAQGKPDDWGAPQGRPDDWGFRQDGFGNEDSGSGAGVLRDRPLFGYVDPLESGRTDDFDRDTTDGFAVRLVEILNQLRFLARK